MLPCIVSDAGVARAGGAPLDHRPSRRVGARGRQQPGGIRAGGLAGADCIEFDVRRTRERRADRVPRRPRRGRARGANSRARRSPGARRRQPPLLDEVFELAAGRVRIDVELKEDGYVDEVVALIAERFAPPEVIVTSFLDAVIARVKVARAGDPHRAAARCGPAGARRLRTRVSELRPSPGRRPAAPITWRRTTRSRVSARSRGRPPPDCPALVWTVNRSEPLARADRRPARRRDHHERPRPRRWSCAGRRADARRQAATQDSPRGSPSPYRSRHGSTSSSASSTRTS